MTENEAIKLLKDECKEQENTIKYLEEIEEQECFIAVHRKVVSDCQQIIGFLEELQALKEKAEPKKPIRNDLCTCPSCGTHNEVIKKRRNTVIRDTVYCWHCGQAIACQRDIDLD